MIEAWSAAVIVTGVGQCIVDELEATPESGGVPSKMRICLLVPGNISWDSCDCGQLAQTIQGDYPSIRFPTDSSLESTQGGCQYGPVAVQVLASITRCVPGMTNGTPPRAPTCAALQASALEIEGDAFALRSAVECCLATYKKNRQIFDFRVGRVNRVGPEGSCAGVELTYWFQLL